MQETSNFLVHNYYMVMVVWVVELLEWSMIFSVVTIVEFLIVSGEQGKRQAFVQERGPAGR